jgi:Fic family protein
LSRSASNELRETARRALAQAGQALEGQPSNYGNALAQQAARSNEAPDEPLLGGLVAALGGPAGYRTSGNLVYKQSRSDLLELAHEAERVPERVADLVVWLARAWEQLPALILAGIAQQELLLIRPFERSNPAAARLLGDVVLWRKGYGFGGFGFVATELAAKVDDYERATESTHSGVYSNPADFSTWLEFYAGRVAAAATHARDEAQARFDAASRPTLESGAPAPPHVLRPRQLKGLEFMRANGAIRSGEYQKLVGIVPDTARRDFDELIDKGLIEVRGVGRGTHYVLTPAGMQEANRRGAQTADIPPE